MTHKKILFILFISLFPAILEGRGTYITDIKNWGNQNYTRIVIYISKKCEFKHNSEEAGSRKYIHLKLLNTRLYITQKRIIKLDSPLVKNIKITLLDKDTGLKIEANGFDNYRVNSFNDPFRIIIDVERKSKEDKLDEESLKNILLKNKIGEAGKSKIIIDPGHGGKDPGTIVHGVKEKDIVLDVSKKIMNFLAKDQKFIPYLTRTADRYLSLEERTAFANIKKGDLFVSIHTNYSQNQDASGMEVYYLDMTDDRGSIKLAARENGTGEVSILEFIKIDLEKKISGNESVNAARIINEGTMDFMNMKVKIALEKRGARPAMFYVLWGTKMPSILIEIGFLSNKNDLKLLKEGDFRVKIAEAICHGIKNYFIRP